jgi:hypothetical protein
MGPFRQAGVILDESQSGCWTVHHSIVDYRNQWYLFYHDRDLSPSFDKNRSIRADKLSFNADGTIRKVSPTLRGVGLVSAQSQIQIDRYSATSGNGIEVAFLDDKHPDAGWQTTFSAAQSWVRFNDVDFDHGGQKALAVRAKAPRGGVLEIRLDKAEGTPVGRVRLDPAQDWKNTRVSVKNIPAGVHDVIVTQSESNAVAVDWVSFHQSPAVP